MTKFIIDNLFHLLKYFKHFFNDNINNEISCYHNKSLRKDIVSLNNLFQMI
jgi:hypothetical protein